MRNRWSSFRKKGPWVVSFTRRLYRPLPRSSLWTWCVWFLRWRYTQYIHTPFMMWYFPSSLYPLYCLYKTKRIISLLLFTRSSQNLLSNRTMAFPMLKWTAPFTQHRWIRLYFCLSASCRYVYDQCYPCENNASAHGRLSWTATMLVILSHLEPSKRSMFFRSIIEVVLSCRALRRISFSSAVFSVHMLCCMLHSRRSSLRWTTCWSLSRYLQSCEPMSSLWW